MRAELSRERTDSNGTDIIDMRSSGRLLADCGLEGAATYDNLTLAGQALTGDVEGHLFGPEAQSIGATFIGHASGSRDSYSQIVGHATLNADR
jgi:hypothetical protein